MGREVAALKTKIDDNSDLSKLETPKEKRMTLDEYAKSARKTVSYKGVGTQRGVIYNSLKLAGEAGEIADKVGKMFGKNEEPTEEQRQDLKKESGDVLWHLTNLVLDLGFTLEEIAQMNIEKLADRQERGVLVGYGDER
jgi:NTP pyrophosphatase (non-canonical NTP hydrolase)